MRKLFRPIDLLCILLLFTPSCFVNKVELQGSTMEKPTSFVLTYEWQEGSVPPPHYYTYTIRLGPDSVGEIIFHPDYAFNNPPVWVEKLEFSTEKFNELFALMAQKAVFSKQWHLAPGVSTGGKLERVEGTANGEHFSVPYPLETNDAQLMAEVYRSIQSFVPSPVWAKLMQQRAEYVQTYLEKQK